MLFPHLSRREQSASDGCHGWSRWGLACCMCRCSGASSGIYVISFCASAPFAAIDFFASMAFWWEWNTLNTVKLQKGSHKLLLIVKQCQFLPKWVHASCIQSESLFILEEITVKTRNNGHICTLVEEVFWSRSYKSGVTDLRGSFFQK